MTAGGFVAHSMDPSTAVGVGSGHQGGDVKDIRCILNWHHWQRRKAADSDSYLQCRRCGKEKHPGALGLMGPYSG